MNFAPPRRATTDDLPQLEQLWQSAGFAAADLEKNFTDFQIVTDTEGRIAAAIALQISGSEGCIHSETFSDFGLTDILRPRLWDRIQTVSKNHGLFRLWTRETAPFWRKEAGLAEPSAGNFAKLPVLFGAPGPGWLVLRLREEGADPEAIEKQFLVFKQAEEARRERIYARARLLRIIGTTLAIVIFILGFILLIRLAKHRPR